MKPSAVECVSEAIVGLKKEEKVQNGYDESKFAREV